MYSFYEGVRSKKFGRTSTNMYLQFKWDTENFANHRYRVKTAKPSIDNSAPLTFTHMFVRPKKLQLELERYSTIQRNNRFLLERLATIQREGAWIDNKNYRQPRSLNTWKRQQEMIHLAHNNQIMIARLQDVNALHNRTKLEDEYLINQKYKANIQKWPPNWRELQQNLNRVKDEIFKKVFDSKYQTEAYHKSRKRAIQKWTLEKAKHAAAKAKKIALEASEAEKREQTAKEERKKAASERKKAMEKWLKSSDKNRSEREKRLKLKKNADKSKAKEAEEKKRESQRRDMEQRQKQKEQIEEWKRKKQEERKKQEDREKSEKLKTKLENKKRIEERKRRALAKEIVPLKKDKESMGFDVETYDRKDGFEKGSESSISDPEKTQLKEEITDIDSTSGKSIADKILPAEKKIPEREASSIEEREDDTIPDKETLHEKPISNENDQTMQQTTFEDEDDYISDPESFEEQIDSEEETPTDQSTTSQKTTQDLSDGESSTSERIITDDNESSDDESLTTDQSTTDRESP